MFSSQARPMTRYLPNRKEEFDLRAHVESSGHSIDTCPYVILTEKMCKGHLVKMGGKIKSWKKRWFVFDRLKRNFCYYVGEDLQFKDTITFYLIFYHIKLYNYMALFTQEVSLRWKSLLQRENSWQIIHIHDHNNISQSHKTIRSPAGEQVSVTGFVLYFESQLKLISFFYLMMI